MMARDIIRAVTARHGLKPSSFRSPHKTKVLVAARSEAARALRREIPTLSKGVIGRLIGRSYWTVQYYLDPEFAARKRAAFRARRKPKR